MMRWPALLGLLGFLPITGSASAASVDVMVVGSAQVLKPAAEVRLVPRTIKVAGGRRCAVGAATPLAALAALRLRTEVTDYGSCGRSARDAAGLFVRRIGPDRNRGQDGWVYKVGRRAGTAGAADPSGSFGDGRRLRDGQRVVWFWCVRSAERQSCQPTLEVTPAARTVKPGASLRVRVRAFDDFGRGAPAAGATVTLGVVRATTGADGFAEVTAPPQAGVSVALTAAKPGTVPAFEREVAVR